MPSVAAVAVRSLFLLTLFLGMTLAEVFSKEGEWGRGYCCSVSWREDCPLERLCSVTVVPQVSQHSFVYQPHQLGGVTFDLQ